MTSTSSRQLAFYLFLTLGIVGILNAVTMTFPFQLLQTKEKMGTIVEFIVVYAGPGVGAFMSVVFGLSVAWLLLAVAIKKNWWRLGERSFLIVNIFAVFFLLLVVSISLSMISEYPQDQETTRNNTSTDIRTADSWLQEMKSGGMTLPFKESEGVTLVDVSASGQIMTYTYEISSKLADFMVENRPESDNIAREAKLQATCTDMVMLYMMMKDKIEFRFNYREESSGNYVHFIKIQPSDCVRRAIEDSNGVTN